MAEAKDEGKNTPKPTSERGTESKPAASVSRIKTVAATAAVASEDDLRDRIAALRDQVALLALRAEQVAEDRFTDAKGMAELAGRRAIVAARAVRDDPLPIIVALGVVALLATLLIGREHDR